MFRPMSLLFRKKRSSLILKTGSFYINLYKHINKIIMAVILNPIARRHYLEIRGILRQAQDDKK